MTTKVEEKDIIVNLKICYFRVFVNDVKLGVSCNIFVSMFDTDMNFLKQENVLLEGEDYKNWGSDDNYIINYVIEKYQFVKDNTPDVVEEIYPPIPDHYTEYV